MSVLLEINLFAHMHLLHWQNFKNVYDFYRFYLVFGQILNIIWQKFAVGQIFNVGKCQVL